MKEERKERMSCGNTNCQCNHMGYCVRNEQKQECHFGKVSQNDFEM